MSLSNTESIDAVHVEGGEAVLLIVELHEWSTLDEPVELLRRKLAFYEAFIESPAFQHRFHRLPVRVRLAAGEPPPDEVLAFCQRNAIELAEQAR